MESQYNIKLKYSSEIDIILNLLFTKYCDDVVGLLKEYNFDRNSMLASLIFNLCNNSTKYEAAYMDKINLLIDNFSYEKTGMDFVISTFLGRIEFVRFTDYIDDEEVVNFINNGNCRRHCHTAASYFSPAFKDSFIVTSFMPGRFGGEYYHSYIELPNNKIIDIASNGVFSKDGYYQCFNPREIIKYPASQLENRYNELSTKTGDAKVLQLALNEVIKKV